jgi:hypothetical protein
MGVDVEAFADTEMQHDFGGLAGGEGDLLGVEVFDVGRFDEGVGGRLGGEGEREREWGEESEGPEEDCG